MHPPIHNLSPHCQCRETSTAIETVPQDCFSTSAFAKNVAQWLELWTPRRELDLCLLCQGVQKNTVQGSSSRYIRQVAVARLRCTFVWYSTVIALEMNSILWHRVSLILGCRTANLICSEQLIFFSANIGLTPRQSRQLLSSKSTAYHGIFRLCGCQLLRYHSSVLWTCFVLAICLICLLYCCLIFWLGQLRYSYFCWARILLCCFSTAQWSLCAIQQVANWWHGEPSWVSTSVLPCAISSF